MKLDNDALTRLIDRARGGDIVALDEVLRLYRPIWQHRLRQMGLQDADAQDVLGELYTAVLKTISNLDHPRAFCAFYNQRLSWLVGQHRRKASRLPSSLSALTDSEGANGASTDTDKLSCLVDADAPDPCVVAFQREEERLVQKALDLLKEINASQAETIRAHYLENRGLEEIAKDQGVPVGTVKSRLFNGRTHLRQILAA